MKTPEELLERLREVIPFRFLKQDVLQAFVASCQHINFDPGKVIMEQGDVSDKTCYILLSGLVEVVDRRAGPDITMGTIEANHYFGEWEAIFNVPRLYAIRALKECECLAFDEIVLTGLLADQIAFAQSLAGILRERQGIFRAFELFDAELARGIGYGHISIHKLLPLYQALEPALHPLANNPDRLDISALDYAVRRLPQNVTSTFAFLIRDELPSVYNNPDEFFPAISSDARHRSIWEILPGKNLFLSRAGASDVMDFISCLCLYACEARKIRHHIYEVKGVRLLRDFLHADQVTPGGEANHVRSLLVSLRFKPQDAEGILRVWPHQTIRHLWELVNHREMFSIDVRTQRSSYNLLHFSRWSTQIGSATRLLSGFDPAALPEGVDVHIISSNTHSITNCLNPWYAENAEKIHSWAKKTKHPVALEDWSIESDCLYAIARDYFKAHSDSEAEMLTCERENGILRLSATASTGIEVQVIDLGQIRGRKVDPLLPVWKSERPTYIVNIDYAFGEQAERILQQLIMLFGRTIRSVNFLGKAGSLVGKRGDILIPNAFIEQSKDLFMPVTLPTDAELESLRKVPGVRGIHTGAMLTVKGTLLQNRLMLNFYRKLWGVKGIEMEGIFYHKQVMESLQTGILSAGLISRFYYYVSDLPLDILSNLSERLKASEGIPPLYAISRQILTGILST